MIFEIATLRLTSRDSLAPGTSSTGSESLTANQARCCTAEPIPGGANLYVCNHPATRAPQPTGTSQTIMVCRKGAGTEPGSLGNRQGGATCLSLLHRDPCRITPEATVTSADGLLTVSLVRKNGRA